MNGVYDLGGMHGFGPVQAEPEATEPIFHHPWEADVLTSMLGTMRLGQWSLDEFRQTIEQQPAIDYLRRTYYEKWLAAVELLAIRHGLFAEAELADRLAAVSATAGNASAGVNTSPAVAGDTAIARTGPDASDPGATGLPGWVPSFELPPEAPRYTVGQTVKAANRHPEGHTRQPRYVRGRVGTIVGHVGAEPLPELAATGVCRPEHVYRVRFEATELWGEAGSTKDAVLIELWDSYLESMP